MANVVRLLWNHMCRKTNLASRPDGGHCSRLLALKLKIKGFGNTKDEHMEIAECIFCILTKLARIMSDRFLDHQFYNSI